MVSVLILISEHFVLAWNLDKDSVKITDGLCFDTINLFINVIAVTCSYITFKNTSLTYLVGITIMVIECLHLWLGSHANHSDILTCLNKLLPAILLKKLWRIWWLFLGCCLNAKKQTLVSCSWLILGSRMEKERCELTGRPCYWATWNYLFVCLKFRSGETWREIFW